jgi:hypothetical protein
MESPQDVIGKPTPGFELSSHRVVVSVVAHDTTVLRFPKNDEKTSEKQYGGIAQLVRATAS